MCFNAVFENGRHRIGNEASPSVCTLWRTEVACSYTNDPAIWNVVYCIISVEYYLQMFTCSFRSFKLCIRGFWAACQGWLNLHSVTCHLLHWNYVESLISSQEAKREHFLLSLKVEASPQEILVAVIAWLFGKQIYFISCSFRQKKYLPSFVAVWWLPM